MIKKLLILFLLTFSFGGYSYVLSKSESGQNLKWKLASDDLVIFVNPAPIGTKAVDVDYTDVISIFNESISEWDTHTPFNLKAIYSTEIPSSSNRMFFSSNPAYFGAGVVAVTEINYNVDTGTIASADIIVNESIYNTLTFTKDESESGDRQAFLGDVFTHELGHFLGLSHSEVIGSSMIYSVFKNQHTVHSDDSSGVLDIYNKTVYSGEMKGKITGGTGNPVFGTHVMLLSADSGKVLQGQISAEDGSFHFKNLPLDNSYYFYITPTKQLSSIPDYYSTVVNSFCQQSSYQGSFFTKCGPRSKGRPQGFALTEQVTEIDVGEITIRCDQNLDSNYLSAKNLSSNRTFELNPTYKEYSQVFVGLFDQEEITKTNLTDKKGDEFSIDLRSLDFGSLQASQLSLKLEFLAAGIGSAFDFSVDIRRLDQGSSSNYTSSVDETGKSITDLTISLNLADASSNIFYITVKPIALTDEQKYTIFSSLSNLTNSVSLYTLNSQVGYYSGTSFVALEGYKTDSYDDNSMCRQASVDYATQAYTPLTAQYGGAQSEIEDGPISGLSCATIDIDDSSGPGGGAMSFLIGFLFILILSQAKQIHMKE